ncbi:aromatic amino acid ammonia-lyase [Thermorudis peleae]|uniref:aromatic amino acid ammonia-lyase n=1 Tax=Thermorudis peleae TaxID=1382356 RepID=UPI00056FEB8C|nr:aromatic amino acid ammonia-lyase [Thermorudis peleae]
MLRLGEQSLTIQDVVRVAVQHEPVSLAPSVINRVQQAWEITQACAQDGTPLYGITTGVGALRDQTVAGEVQQQFNQRLLWSHSVASGEWSSVEAGRAALLCLLNQLSTGFAPIRPQTLMVIVEALNTQIPLRFRLSGSIGASDLAANADLVSPLFTTVPLYPGEGLILLNHTSPTIGLASLAIWETQKLLRAGELVLATSLEAFGANLGAYHPAIAQARHSAMLASTMRRLTAHLEGSQLWNSGTARMLQDPLSFRCGAQLFSTAWESLATATDYVIRWLNTYHGNPMVIPEERRLVSCGNFESADISTALDYLRCALVPLLQASAERSTKLLNSPWSGLPTGLTTVTTLPDSGYAILEIAAHALVTEARTLAAPVALEPVSGAIAAGIEDRGSFALLAARRLVEQLEIAWRIISIELLVSHHALLLRRPVRIGKSIQSLQNALLDEGITQEVSDSPADQLIRVRRCLHSWFDQSTEVPQGTEGF